MFRTQLRFLAAIVAAFALVGAVASGGAAQQAVDAAHPSHVHAGTCAELDPNPAYPLADVAPVSADAAPGSIEVGVTSIDTTLDDLLASPYAINVHASAEDVATYIACGDIAGPVIDGTLIVGLQAQNASGYSGVAALTTNETGGTDVAVYLGFGLTGTAAAAPVAAATPEADHAMHEPAAAEEVAVSIFDFGFDGASVEVPLGTTVTWTNDGQVIHTTTSKDGLWDSAIMQAGDTFSYTFDEAGTFEYWCTLHPDMLATIVVTEP